MVLSLSDLSGGIIDLEHPGRTALVAIGAYGIYKTTNFFVQLWSPAFLSPLRNLPGPTSYQSYIWGNLPKILESETPLVHQEWFAQYGPTISYRGFMLAPTLCTKDIVAMNYILSHNYDFPKPDEIRTNLARLFGKGVLFAEGNDHRRQRKIMNPCFGQPQMRDILPIFYDKAEMLHAIWLNEVDQLPTGASLETYTSLTRATMDVIGLAGFDYDFNSLKEGDDNELATAFRQIFNPRPSRAQIFGFLQNRWPILRVIPSKEAKAMRASRGVLTRVSKDLVRKKHAALINVNGKVEKAAGDRDLLSVLVQSNMDTDIQESQKMSDEEFEGQIATMLIAGHETTSTSLAWLLWDLANPEHQSIQTKLREELRAVEAVRPSMEELNSLPYLDAVVRETLRKNSVVDSTIRCASKDDVIPVSTPYVDKHGVERNDIRVSAGDRIFIPILAMNRDKTIWGEDAQEFKPERWLDPNNPARKHADRPGVFAGMMTFLGGPRSCIGYRMAILEMKVIIFAIMRDFKFERPDPPVLIERKSQIVARPAIKLPDGTFTATMPLRVTAVRNA